MTNPNPKALVAARLRWWRCLRPPVCLLGSARLGNLSESPAEHQFFFYNGPELEAVTKKSFVAKGRHGPHGALLGTMSLSFLLLFLPLPCAAGYLLPAERERRKTAVTQVAGGTKDGDQARIYMEVKWRPRMWMWRAVDNKKARGRDGWRLSEIANKKKKKKTQSGTEETDVMEKKKRHFLRSGHRSGG